MFWKTGLIVCLLSFATTANAALTAGSCESKASSAGAVATVRLVNEWIPGDEGEDGYYSGDGVYYFKATLNRSNSYTIWTDYFGTNDVTLTAYAAEPANEDDFGPSADFTDIDEGEGACRMVMEAGDWYIDDEDPSESDPKKWTYYFVLSGEIGTEVTFHFSSGVIIPQGRAENPRSISPGKTLSRVDTTLESGATYYFRAKLTGGRLYSFGTTGGTSNSVLSVSFYPESEKHDVDIYENSTYAGDEYNAGYYMVPSDTGYYQIVVDGMGDDERAAFGLEYLLVDERAIGSHTALEIKLDTPVDVVAGYKSNTMATRAYDEIIDESLFSFSAAKGDRFVAYTTGAQTNLLMRFYDSKGTILAENTADGYGYDVRSVFEATSSGLHYVGVCQNIADEFVTVPAYTEATLHLEYAAAADGAPDEWDAADDVNAGATGLAPLPATSADKPIDVDADGHGWHALGKTDWADTFVIAARKGITYVLSVSLENPLEVSNSLKAEVYTLSGSSEKTVSTSGDINPGAKTPLSFAASANAAYYIRLSVSQGRGLDYPNYKVHAMAYAKSGGDLGILTVNTPGAPSATWSIGSESAKYPSGSSVLLNGEQKIKFSTVKGYKAAVATTNVTVKPGTTPTVVDVFYSDTFDPKDDNAKGATGLTLKNVETEYASRTLWENDPEDNFSFAGVDGYYYNLALKNVEGDDVTFSITNAEAGIMAENVTSISQLTLPKMKSKYFLTVKNGAGATVFGGYALAGRFANVGAIKFDKVAVSVKEDAATATVKVKRTAKDGYVRVKYGTVAGTAVPGVDYVAQNGVLEWADGDNKDKTIAVKLIPDLVPVYEGNKTFSVQLKVFEADERASNEYPASIVGGDTCTVTLTETAKAGTTAADAYAKKMPKLATVKTEDVPLETGTFYGVLEEDGSALTNGLPQLASVTLTASTASPAKLSAKVALAGKTYTFAATGWDEGETEGTLQKEFLLAQKVNRIDEETGKSVSTMVTNTLVVTVNTGATATDGDWLNAGAEAVLVMNVPDANNKGYQEEILYRGALYRNNAKIQDYLTVVTNFTGYYTMALAPEGVTATDGVPAGNGYLTLTVDNKGTAKVAGVLADGTTKLSLSVAACAIKPDTASVSGYAMFLPLFFVKAPAVFGGTLRLFMDESGMVVVDSSGALIWNNDNAKLTYAGEEGYRLLVDPVGGWYDTVINLQAYYLNYLFQVGTADISEFPTEVVASGYQVVTDVEPNGTPAELSGAVFSTAKKSLVKSGKLYDLVNSVNPCNVQVKLARATGIVSGTFSIWSEKEDGSAQKEISGIKHFGVLVLTRDAAAPLDDEILSAGFCTKAVKVTDENEETGKTSTRNWTFSLPFNLVGIDQGDIDWWADDWGEEPILGD